MADEDTPWYLHLLISLAVIVGVAALIGGILAVGSVGAAYVFGATGSRPSSSVTSVDIPTPSPPATSSASSPQSPSSSPTNSPSRTHRSPRPHTPQQAITLAASPLQVSAGEHINLTGSYSAPDGTTLQVQREESPGVWADFPVTTTLHGGSYTTYILTSRTGTNKLRMLDSSTGQTSNVVMVQVG